MKMDDKVHKHITAQEADRYIRLMFDLADSEDDDEDFFMCIVEDKMAECGDCSLIFSEAYEKVITEIVSKMDEESLFSKKMAALKICEFAYFYGGEPKETVLGYFPNYNGTWGVYEYLRLDPDSYLESCANEVMWRLRNDGDIFDCEVEAISWFGCQIDRFNQSLPAICIKHNLDTWLIWFDGLKGFSLCSNYGKCSEEEAQDCPRKGDTEDYSTEVMKPYAEANILQHVDYHTDDDEFVELDFDSSLEGCPRLD